MSFEVESKKTVARTMADFVFGLDYRSLPPAVLAAARRHLADSLACAVGACDTPPVNALQNYTIAKGGRGAATLLGTEQKVPAALAALVNGTMVRYLDANDIFVMSRGGASGHCSDGTPALLALAEQYARSGEELLTCLVASYELQGALAETFNFWQHGLHVLTNVGWIIPIVAARLAGTTPQVAVHACGLSVATNTVLNTWLRPAHSIPMIKGVAVGLVLERALENLELAATGVTATEDALERAIACLQPRGDPEIVRARLEQLGQRWTMTRNLIKAYPAQLYTQPAIEAVLRLYDRGVRAERVRKLILHGHRNVCGGVQGSSQAFAPASREAADHSTPFVMAMALMRGRLTAREFADDPWESAEVRSLMAKIELVEEPASNRALDNEGILGVRLAAELADGTLEEVDVRQPKGHPDAPLSDSELLEKMTWLLADIVPARTAARLFELCHRLSTANDINSLLKACRSAPE